MAKMLDVRSIGERGNGYGPGSTIIPLEDLEEKIKNSNYFSKEDDIYVYCRSG